MLCILPLMKQALQSFHLLTDEEIDFLLTKAVHRTLKRKETFLIRERKICQEIGFV